TFLSHAVDIEGLDSRSIARLKAEARFIRNFLFFRLANLYGDVPLFMSDPTLEAASNISRTPHGEVIRTITADLEDLIADLPANTSMPDAERGRITRGAAAMLRARIALMESDWDNVEKWCQRIVDGEFGHYELFPSYSGLFSEENEYNCEVILDCGYVNGVRTWGNINQMKPPTLRSSTVTWTPTQSLVDTYLTMGGYSIDEAGTDYNPARPYNNRDPRLGATVVYDNSTLYDPCTGQTHTIFINPSTGISDDNVGIGTGLYKTVTGYYTRKWFSPIHDDNGYQSGLNIIMMRYADVLLMLAEAKNELGKMNETVWNNTIRLIRQRAGFTASKAIDYPAGADMQRIIRNERRVELALEGLRWWDIKRWKAGKEYLDGPVKGCTFVGGAEVLDTYSFDENRDYLWAVPLNEIDFNPNLKPQNAGYGN
ncbi:MAG: RagB/SusD family nutrient uptake outer membrane protein, partial [Muribaculaceae bacterium]|nr:RagB/SusD family nutrient uptake outer membrane protein [Muribaculaceae bacterium]